MRNWLTSGASQGSRILKFAAIVASFLALSVSSALAQTETVGGEANLKLPDLHSVTFFNGWDGHFLLLIGILFFLRYRLNVPGLLAAVYLIGYATSQFIVFFLRDSEPIVGFGFKQAQLTSLVVFIAALGLAAWRIRASREETTSASSSGAVVGDST